MEVKVADVFECPQCGGNWIEEVQTNVVLSSEVTGIETEESELLYARRRGTAGWLIGISVQGAVMFLAPLGRPKGWLPGSKRIRKEC